MMKGLSTPPHTTTATLMLSACLAASFCCSKYIILPTNLNASETFSVVLDQDYLDEGYYRLQAKLAMITQFPSLVDLDGRAPVVQVRPDPTWLYVSGRE